MMNRLSLRARLTIWYTLALLLVLSLFGANVLWQQRRIGIRRVDRELEALTATVVNVVGEELSEADDPWTAASEATTLVTAPGRALAIYDEYGELLSAKWGGLELHEPPPRGDAEPSVRTVRDGASAWRVHQRPRTIGGLTFTLLLASPVADVMREQREVQEAMLVGIPIVLLVAAGGGLAHAGRATVA